MVLHRALALCLLCVWVPLSVPVRQKMSCLPTQIDLEACHTSVWGVSSQEDGRLQTSCACTMCLRTFCPSIGSKHVSGWSGKRHLNSSYCSIPEVTDSIVTQAGKWAGQKNPQKCCSVAGRKSLLLTSLSSHDSVLMERLLWKDSVVSPFLGGLHH